MRTSYLQLSGKCLKRIIQRVAKKIRHDPKLKSLQAVAVRGVSGMLVGPGVAAELGIPLIVVRKDTKKCHSHDFVEGSSRKNCKYVILDDFIEEGYTVYAIYKAVQKFNNTSKCLGVVLYTNTGSRHGCVYEDFYITRP